MIALLQRVSSAQVSAEGKAVGAIGVGLLAFIGVEHGDNEGVADRLLERVLGYRIFPDCAGKMNASVSDVGGGLLLVPQFTLAADTRKGMRPSFSPAAPPEEGVRLFEYLLARARASHPVVAAGPFGVHMRVALINDGPATFWLRTPPQTDDPDARRRTAGGPASPS
jgi:D-tyrosyl-tRNA(Tyr) deacylase